MLRWLRWGLGAVVLAAAVLYLWPAIDAALRQGTLADVAAAVRADPLGLATALLCYAAAFGLRTWAWHRTLPGLSPGHSWAALHVSLLGNHVLPLRLGEMLRVTSVLRRTQLDIGPVLASSITLRAADLLAVLTLAVLAAPALLTREAGPWLWVVMAVAMAAAIVGRTAMRRLDRAANLRRPTAMVGASVVAAWALEAAVVWEIARTAGYAIAPVEAIAVTAVTIAVQAVAVTPGGLGTYEAAATAALVAFGVPAGPAFGIALTTHAVKTAYALAVGGVALFAPGPSYWGWLRLPRPAQPRPPAIDVPVDAPVVAFLPVHNEGVTIATVLDRLPSHVAGRPLVTLVVDDGSTDESSTLAEDGGALVVRHASNLGLGAAVRRGLAEAVQLGPAAVIYLDADHEYDPRSIPAVAAPVLDGTADYVVGSRFLGDIRHMLRRRRLGNQVLTAWVRWLTRRGDISDGQSGFRAFSPAAAAAAEVVHDYNYAQVLTLDLLGKGFVYAEVPIDYAFRRSGTSFVRLGTYLRRVVPAVHRELNAELRGATQSSTTWSVNRRRAAAQASGSRVPSARNASTAS